MNRLLWISLLHLLFLLFESASIYDKTFVVGIHTRTRTTMKNLFGNFIGIWSMDEKEWERLKKMWIDVRLWFYVYDVYVLLKYIQRPFIFIYDWLRYLSDTRMRWFPKNATRKHHIGIHLKQEHTIISIHLVHKC